MADTTALAIERARLEHGAPRGLRGTAEHRAQLNKYVALAKSGEKAVLKEVVSQYLARAKEKVAEREAKPSSARGDDDSAGAWKKYVEVYEKKLKSLESP